ncbi:MAG: ankyrin repeat domain-containing protein [bacterium]|nr:ankyrin repeat domain-containing protein [bacterium]
MNEITYKFELFADCYQVHLVDDQKEKINTDFSWDEESVDNLFIGREYAIGIGTVRNMSVPVSVTLVDTEPDINFYPYDNVIESCIHIKSGRMLVSGPMPSNDIKKIALDEGEYRVLVLYKNLDSLSWDGLSGDDSYHIYLWPSNKKGTVIIKKSSIPEEDVKTENLSWLISAILDNDPEAVKEILNSDVDINRVCQPLVHLPLTLAISLRPANKKIIELLIDAGADLTARDQYDMTPLDAAVYTGNMELVQYFLNAGAVPDYNHDGAFSALTEAKAKGYTDIIALID